MRKPMIKIRGTLLLLLFLLLIIPILQVTFNIIGLTDLKGAINRPEKAHFSFSNWFSGEFQEKQEKYLNETFGFRSLFIRINNQIAFNSYKQAKANGVIVGKDNYLFEENYIKAYYGTDFIGVDSITHRMSRLKFIQDTLAQLNKNLILVFAAGKGSFYPEYFPDRYKTSKGKTNYEVHVDLSQKMGINYIDFNRYFVENKTKSKYPLYPQYGIHWSDYGMCLAADSIIRFIEDLRNIDMPNLSWDDIILHQPKGTDYDIADGMNLLFRLKSFKMAYPRFKFQSDSVKTKPSVLVISDSFYWGMFNAGISTNAFSNSHFWFYNKQIYPDSFESPVETNSINLKDEIDKHEVIIILATEATLPGFGWGFIEETYNLFKGITEEVQVDVEFQRKVAQYSNSIKSDKKWLKQIEEKAILNKISIDSMITLDAIWLIQHENNSQ